MTEQCPHCRADVMYITDVCPRCLTSKNELLTAVETPVAPAAPKRPIRLTVISWIFIFLSFFELSKISLVVDEGRVGDQLLDMGLLTGLLFIYGVGMLNRKNWARMLYLWLTPFCWILSLLSGATATELVIALIVYALCARMLTRPAVSAYFTPVGPA